jgi:hypothetical protein
MSSARGTAATDCTLNVRSAFSRRGPGDAASKDAEGGGSKSLLLEFVFSRLRPRCLPGRLGANHWILSGRRAGVVSHASSHARSPDALSPQSHQGTKFEPTNKTGFAQKETEGTEVAQLGTSLPPLPSVKMNRIRFVSLRAFSWPNLPWSDPSIFTTEAQRHREKPKHLKWVV